MEIVTNFENCYCDATQEHFDAFVSLALINEVGTLPIKSNSYFKTFQPVEAPMIFLQSNVYCFDDSDLKTIRKIKLNSEGQWVETLNIEAINDINEYDEYKLYKIKDLTISIASWFQNTKNHRLLEHYKDAIEILNIHTNEHGAEYAIVDNRQEHFDFFIENESEYDEILKLMRNEKK